MLLLIMSRSLQPRLLPFQVYRFHLCQQHLSIHLFGPATFIITACYCISRQQVLLVDFCRQLLHEKSKGDSHCVGVISIPCKPGGGYVIPLEVNVQQLNEIHGRFLKWVALPPTGVLCQLSEMLHTLDISTYSRNCSLLLVDVLCFWCAALSSSLFLGVVFCSCNII